VHHIDYVETSSELVAFLLEDQEIRLHSPKYNAAQKKKRPKVGLFQFEDQQGYLRLMAAQLSGQKTPLRIFPTLPQANKWLVKFCSYHGFSLKAIGMFSEEELTSLEEHNERMVAAMKMAFNPQHAILTHRGRDGSEFVFVLVEDGLPKGYGFINEHIDTISSVDDLKDRLIPLNTSELSAGFIQHFMDAPQGHRVKSLTS
jgi:DNA polymerase-3 subunit epsilon